MDGIQTLNFCSSPATHKPTEVRVKKIGGGGGMMFDDLLDINLKLINYER